MKKLNKNIVIIILLIVVIVLGVILVNKFNNENYNQSQNISKEELEKIPTTDSKIKNVIFMIGDGMGENHIIAAEIYKGEQLNIQTIKNKSYVKTCSLQETTDSAAGATALATGHKTNNGTIGKDENGNDLENLIEYSNKRGLKTGVVCTQILNHATPAGFTVHNDYRYNYDRIAQDQIESCVDLMLGGGRKYFSKYEYKMLENNFIWVNTLNDLEKLNKSNKVIGTFSESSLSEENNKVKVADLTKKAISRLENSNGFFLMVEGSDIDSYSHKSDMDKMLDEMINFDDAVSIAKEYVDTHQDTLLIITADHETGGLNLEGVKENNQLTDSLFTSNGNHTNVDVLVYAYGVGAEDLTRYDVIDNTSISKFIRQGIANNYEK